MRRNPLEVIAMAVVPASIVLSHGCRAEPPRADERPPATVAATQGHEVSEARPAVPPRRPRPESVSPGTSCSTAGCHDLYARAAFVHAPVASDACDACHGPEQAGHKFPLRRSEADTCTFCHVALTGKSHPHKPAADGTCTACHDPHAAPHKFLYRTSVAESCSTCHPLADRKFAHGPFATGACTACHVPHEADNPRLTIAPGAENCYRCHAEMRARLTAATTKHPPVESGCVTCHEPHSADQRFTLKTDPQTLCLQCHEPVAATVRTAAEQHGALLVQSGCGNCHDAHGSGEPKLLRDRVASLCLTCHDREQAASDGRTIRSVKAEVTQREFLHGPIRQGQCQECHQVHGSSNRRLLAQYFPETFYAKFDLTNYALCFSCHEQAMVMDRRTTTLTGFRNGEHNLHYAHVHREKGRTCSTCHAIHGSDLPKHMAEAVPFEGGGWQMPIGFKKIATGGSCAPGCHQPYSYDREKAVMYPTTQEMER